MLNPRPSSSVSGSRALQALPLVLAAAAVATMQATLLPVRLIRFEIPSTIAIGAAPEYSVAPASAKLETPPLAVLPSESQPPAETAPATELRSGAAAPGAQRIFPEAETWIDRLPRAGEAGELSGNLKLRAKQPTPISTLVAGIMKSLNRIHPTAILSAKALAQRMAAVKPAPKRAVDMILLTRPQPRPNFAGLAIGGAMPQRNVLGGPAVLAPRYEPVVSGTGVARYR